MATMTRKDVKESMLAVKVIESSGGRQSNAAAFHKETLPLGELFFPYSLDKS